MRTHDSWRNAGRENQAEKATPVHHVAESACEEVAGEQVKQVLRAISVRRHKKLDQASSSADKPTPKSWRCTKEEGRQTMIATLAAVGVFAILYVVARSLDDRINRDQPPMGE